MATGSDTRNNHDGKTRSTTRPHDRGNDAHSGNHETKEELHREKHRKKEEKRENNRDILAKDEPFVLESSEYDPEFPAMSEFEVDEGGFKGSKSKHPGLIWIIVAIIAVAILVIVFIWVGDWMNPTQAEQEAQTQFEEQTIPEDLGAN